MVLSMRVLILIITLLALPLPAFAGIAEAKDLAKALNCTVKNIVLADKSAGENSTTTYKVDCDVPASASEADKKANGTLLIKCEYAMCSLLKKGE
ncbi:MAG: hypothetical protein EB059_09120 [Alphaproteobacteria bacterium]|nr:hypothetical protein [Alphaproteobacteria bacterium]